MTFSCSAKAPLHLHPIQRTVFHSLVAAGLLLCLSGTAQAHRARSFHAGRARVTAHAIPLAMVTPLEPGVIPEPDAPLPEDGKHYSLRLNALHTGESLDIVYRIGDTYLPVALEKLNYLLRDRHTDEVNDYDPREFDLLHNVLARLGRPAGEVDVVCGYRSPETNQALREQSANSGVAEHSQHIQARAIDIRVPGVPTARLRSAALSLEAGGVGYYPVSQFVHVDVGPVRTWTFAPVKYHRGHGHGKVHGNGHGKVRRRRS